MLIISSEVQVAPGVIILKTMEMDPSMGPVLYLYVLVSRTNFLFLKLKLEN